MSTWAEGDGCLTRKWTGVERRWEGLKTGGNIRISFPHGPIGVLLHSYCVCTYWQEPSSPLYADERFSLRPDPPSVRTYFVNEWALYVPGITEKTMPAGSNKLCWTVDLCVLLVNLHFRLTFVHSTAIAKSFARAIFLALSHAYSRFTLVLMFVFKVCCQF